jgi:dipeptidase E
MAERRLLLLSNSKNPDAGVLEHALVAIRDFLGAGARRVVFVPYASVARSWDDYAAWARPPFEALGYEFSSAHAGGDPAAAVRDADAVFVGGGNTFQLLRALYDTGLVEALRARVRDGMPYMGASAGTNVACPTIKTTNDMPIIEPPTFDALGLVPFQINPHYTDATIAGHGGETRDERLGEFLRVNPGVRVVGLREGTMLRVEGDRVTLLGDRPARVFTGVAAHEEYAPGASLQLLLG